MKWIRNYFKLQILNLLKNRLIVYLEEKAKELHKQNEWENKKYDGKCIILEKFEETKKDSIKFFHEQYIIYHCKCKVVEELINEIEKL